MKLYMLERRALPNGLWREVGSYSTWSALQRAKKRDQQRPRGDPCEWQVTQLAADEVNLSETVADNGETK